MNPLIRLRTALAGAALALAAAAAPAADFSFSGAIDFTEDATVAAGTPFHGRFAVTLPAADFDGDVALTAFSVEVAGLHFTLADADPAARPAAFFSAGSLAALQYSGGLASGAALSWYTGFPSATTGRLDLVGPTARLSSGAFSVSAVPEPATVALLLAGLGLVAAAARRRR